MKKLWNWLLQFSARRLAVTVYIVPPEFAGLVQLAMQLCREIDKIQDVSGEWKRHQVYATMLKVLEPKLAVGVLQRRHLALAIEVALNASADY